MCLQSHGDLSGKQLSSLLRCHLRRSGDDFTALFQSRNVSFFIFCSEAKSITLSAQFLSFFLKKKLIIYGSVLIRTDNDASRCAADTAHQTGSKGHSFSVVQMEPKNSSTPLVSPWSHCITGHFHAKGCLFCSRRAQ